MSHTMHVSLSYTSRSLCIPLEGVAPKFIELCHSSSITYTHWKRSHSLETITLIGSDHTHWKRSHSLEAITFIGSDHTYWKRSFSLEAITLIGSFSTQSSITFYRLFKKQEYKYHEAQFCSRNPQSSNSIGLCMITELMHTCALRMDVPSKACGILKIDDLRPAFTARLPSAAAASDLPLSLPLSNKATRPSNKPSVPPTMLRTSALTARFPAQM